MERRKINLDQFILEVKEAKGEGALEDVKFICPRCKTPQSANDLIKAGAGVDLDDVEKYLAFSCIGRFTKEKGCDWTLGGLLQIHELQVMDRDGNAHPRFEIYKDTP